MINLKTRRIKTAALAALLTVTLLAAAGCKRNLFPASGVVAGWDKGDKTQTFDASTLWQYIDGGADQYVNAGLVSAATSDYKYQGNLEAVVDIYTMKPRRAPRKSSKPIRRLMQDSAVGRCRAPLRAQPGLPQRQVSGAHHCLPGCAWGSRRPAGLGQRDCEQDVGN